MDWIFALLWLLNPINSDEKLSVFIHLYTDTWHLIEAKHPNAQYVILRWYVISWMQVFCFWISFLEFCLFFFRMGIVNLVDRNPFSFTSFVGLITWTPVVKYHLVEWSFQTLCLGRSSIFWTLATKWTHLMLSELSQVPAFHVLFGTDCFEISDLSTSYSNDYRIKTNTAFLFSNDNGCVLIR